MAKRDLVDEKRGVVADLYNQLITSRSVYLNRAYKSAELTIPALLPRMRNSGQELPVPYQSVGAHGTNNLASKLLLSVLPANSPFFRLLPTDKVLDEIKAEGNEEARTNIETKLGVVEREAMSEIESSGDRVAVHETMLHLLVSGNVLMNVSKEGTRVFHLDRFVIKRNPEGLPTVMIVEEEVSPEDLPEEIRPQVSDKLKQENNKFATTKLYTQIKRDGDFYRVHQEVTGIPVPRSHGTYPIDKCPWIPLRFTRVDGEDYGRSFIDGLMGDLQSLEHLTKAIVEGSLAASKVIFFVDPTGHTRIKTISKSRSGAIREGRANDVSVLQMDKAHDFSVALQTAQRIEERLARSFLMNSSVQRDAERVTREEIRFMAQELESGLGGFYSILSQEFQLPYARVRLALLPKGRRLPKDLVRPSIVTGLEALGRGNDLQKLDIFLKGAQETVGPEAIAAEMNVGDYLNRRATALGLDTKGLFKTPEQKQAEAQQNQMMQMVQQLGPEALKQMGQSQQAQQAQQEKGASNG